MNSNPKVIDGTDVDADSAGKIDGFNSSDFHGWNAAAWCGSPPNAPALATTT
jgi:hypothetical protein